MGWKSNTAVITEIETCHENKKLQLESKPAGGLGRGLRSHNIPGELRLEGTLEVSSNHLGVCWACSSLAPRFLSRGWPNCMCCSRCGRHVPRRGSRHRPPSTDHTAWSAVTVLTARVHCSSRFTCCPVAPQGLCRRAALQLVSPQPVRGKGTVHPAFSVCVSPHWISCDPCWPVPPAHGALAQWQPCPQAY